MANVATIMGHVQEIGKRMKVVIITFFVSTVAMILLPGNLSFFSDPLGSYEPFVGVLLKNIRTWVLPSEVRLIGVGMSDPIELYFQVAIVFALCFTIPVFAYNLYRFIDPAISLNEKKQVYPFAGSVLGLFVSGMSFGFFVLFPLFVNSMLPFFNIVGAEPFVSVADFYSMLLFTVISAGLLFTFPAWLVLSVKIGLVKTATFSKNRKYLYLLILILTMVITPGNSPQENVAFLAPMLLLFELALLFARRTENKKQHL